MRDLQPLAFLPGYPDLPEPVAQVRIRFIQFMAKFVSLGQAAGYIAA